MKPLIWKIILPLSIISFSIFTKWWYVLPVDAPKTMMWGFPFIWLSEGWHTSMSLQIFMSAWIADFALYFLFWFSLVFLLHRFVVEISVRKIIVIVLMVLSGLFCLLGLAVGMMPEHVYKFKRDVDIEVLASGFCLLWEHQEKPE
jgi:hypothetical protein